ncbi:MAG TPA: hypothetical protein DEV93_13465 [Chloroflexi bacterium]|nr:hypothetical protein [Chloroflexota bacterium]
MWSTLIMDACRISTYAVELSALGGNELGSLIEYLGTKPKLPFRYVSVHAPVKNRQLDDTDTVRLMSTLPLWVRSIVTHPDAIQNIGPYRALKTRLVLENMDRRKSTGRYVAEIQACFDELPEAGFCLDVAHARSIDPTMSVAHQLLDRFRSRLRQVHVSSLVNGRHVPLTRDDEDAFGRVLARCRDVPWILEARPPGRWLAVKGTSVETVEKPLT